MDEGKRTSPATDPLLALVRERYGARLSEAQLDEVRKAVETIEQTARALRAVRLEIAEAPMPPFAPFRADA